MRYHGEARFHYLLEVSSGFTLSCCTNSAIKDTWTENSWTQTPHPELDKAGQADMLRRKQFKREGPLRMKEGL